MHQRMLSSIYTPLDASSTPLPNCGNPRFLQTLPPGPWRGSGGAAKSPLVENRYSRSGMRANARDALLAQVTLFFGFVRARGWYQAPGSAPGLQEPGSLTQHQLPSEAAVSWISPLTHGMESFLSFSPLISEQGRVVRTPRDHHCVKCSANQGPGMGGVLFVEGHFVC